MSRADAPVAGKVALLSGGGSDEPMHCGYIGQRMLSGACPGEIFTSPTPDKIFECAMQIDGGEGVLLIIKITPAIFLTSKQQPSYCTIAA